MKIDRLKLHALLGNLMYAEEPTDETGGGASEDKSPEGGDQKENSGSGDRESGDEDEESDEGDKGSSGFTPITSQEDLDRVLGKRLDRERAKFADYDDLKQALASKETEIATLQEKLGERELQDRRKSIADEAGVPENLLRGADEAELKAHAEELKAAFSKTEEDDRTAARRAARSPHTGTGEDRPLAPSQEQGREAARAYLDKNKQRKGKV